MIFSFFWAGKLAWEDTCLTLVPFPAPFSCSGYGPPLPAGYGEMTMDLYISSTSDEYGVGLLNEKIYTVPPAFVNM